MIHTNIAELLESGQIDLSRPVIFYGAGQMAPGISESIMQHGINPVCYADKGVTKYGKTMLGKKVMPLAVALKQYPNPQIFITTGDVLWQGISNELVSSGLVDEQQIINLKLSKLNYCKHLCYDLVIYGAVPAVYMTPCCMWAVDARPQIEMGLNDYDYTVSKYMAFRDMLINKLSLGSDDYCRACPHLQKKLMFDGGGASFDFMNFGEHGVCNFDCCYCTGNRERVAKQKLIDYSKLLSALQYKGLLTNRTRITITCGEITVHPQCDEMLSAFECLNNQKVICTNASFFSKKIAAMMNNSNTGINVSVDAGTRETYARIKGRDLFDRVIKNLGLYASTNGFIKMKYILLPGINDNKTDVDGFLKLCSEINATDVILSKDRNDKGLLEETVAQGKYMYKAAFELGFICSFTELTANEINFITSC